MSAAEIDSQDRYVMHEYAAQAPFASFLPGIAGPLGKPLWVFYVNRAQAVAGFGIQDKNTPIMEFRPANQAYRTVSALGFRTFLKVRSGAAQESIHEPFGVARNAHRPPARLHIGLNEIEICESNEAVGLETSVLYFGLPSECFPGLVRLVVIRNISDRAIQGEVLDGLPAVIPHGVANAFLKDMSNTVTAWMRAENLAAGIPFYRVHSSIEDRPEVTQFDSGHFYLSFAKSSGGTERLRPIVDPDVIFGSNTALSFPDRFREHTVGALAAGPQVTSGKVPCAFAGVAVALDPGAELVIGSLIGHVDDIAMINRRADALACCDYLERKRAQAVELGRNVTRQARTTTSSKIFDLYCRQNFLDNTLRGGQPLLIPTAGEKPHICYIYGRRHGDLERDYNWFTLLPEYYSQGNGAYRDVNQNRRWDVFFEPRIEEHTLITFMNLIQADGYNPLEIRPCTFTLSPDAAERVLQNIPDAGGLRAMLLQPFTPGHVLRFVEYHGIATGMAPESFLEQLLAHAQQEEHADFGEGYWVDHWVYNLDLLDSYLALYPERRETLLFEPHRCTFYDSAAVVLPRADRTVLVGDRVRQLGAVAVDADKQALIRSRTTDPHLMRAQQGRGAVYRTHLFGKLLCLGAVKFATRDPLGMGLEMEAGKPGWYDPLNGLPALFGSSMSETYELRRLLSFLEEVVSAYPDVKVAVAEEIWTLIQQLVEAVEHLQEDGDDFAYWDRVSGLREAYRARTRFGFEGKEVQRRAAEFGPALSAFRTRVQQGIDRARALNGGLPPTYFMFEPAEWTALAGSDGAPRQRPDGLLNVTVRQFSPQPLPLFLEGVVKEMKLSGRVEEARALHRRVKQSALFDTRLKMFKANASLDSMPLELGRVRAFNPGWLENESVFLHMHYKYLLALLKAGLQREFWEEARCGLVPFLDPAVYGRSILENSSFIVSSAHPDPTWHGRGFVGRLSGSSAEFVNMWIAVLVGEKPFALSDAGLVLQFSPALPSWLFGADGTVAFNFLGTVPVVYHNPGRQDLFVDGDARITTIKISAADGSAVELREPVVREPWASRIRARAVQQLDVFFG